MTTTPTPAQVASRARSGGPTATLLPYDDVAAERVAAARARLHAARERGEVYGLSTGVGALRHVVVSAAADESDDVTQEEADDALRSGGGPAHTLRLWRSHAGGVGPEIDDDLARATMLVRAHQLMRGTAGVSPGLVAALVGALESGGVPRLHAFGGIGTGDLTALSELGLTLVGDQPWRTPPAGGARAEVLDGDALPFISSNALTAAVGCLGVTDLSTTAGVVEEVAALSFLALQGAPQALDARVYASKDDAGAAGAAARMRALLALDGGAAGRGDRLQDPFSLRTVPQVHGTLDDALAQAERALGAEVGGGAENPLAVDGEALHHGQFLTQRIAAALDALRSAVYPAAVLSAARTSALMDPALTGLPPFLAQGPPGSSGLLIVEYVVQDVLARMRTAIGPVTIAGAIVSLGLEEHASFSTQAAWQCRELVGLLPELVAGELVAAVRALRLAPERQVPCPALELWREADARLPDVRTDHVLGEELRAAAGLVRERAVAAVRLPG